MRTKKNLLAIAAALVVCILVVWSSTSTQGDGRTYEIHPQVALPYGYTPAIDTHRLIELIEHLTTQNQQITQNQMCKTDKVLKHIVKKLDSVSAELAQLSKRMAGIEKALGIEQHTTAAGKNPQSKTADEKPEKKSVPSM